MRLHLAVQFKRALHFDIRSERRAPGFLCASFPQRMCVAQNSRIIMKPPVQILIAIDVGQRRPARCSVEQHYAYTCGGPTGAVCDRNQHCAGRHSLSFYLSLSSAAQCYELFGRIFVLECS
jgi:hypothetical protein